MNHDMKILFLHDICGSKYDFTYLIEEFDANQIIAFDLPGFGESKKPEELYDKKFFLKHIKQFVHEPIVIVGHSMGAMLAKDFALAYPELVRKVFLISYPLQQLGLQMHDFQSTQKKSSLSNILRTLHLLYEFIFNHKYFDSACASFSYTENSLMSTMRDYVSFDNPEDIHKIIDKTVLILGSDDTQYDREFADEFFPTYIQGMRHELFGFEKKIAGIIKADLNF